MDNFALFSSQVNHSFSLSYCPNLSLIVTEVITKSHPTHMDPHP